MPRSPCAGLLPVEVGSVRLTEAELGTLTMLMPLRGKAEGVADILRSSLGLELPAPNKSTTVGRARLIWFGRDIYMLAGAAAPAELSKFAAVTDQSDAWACVEISGVGLVDVLARLVPVDLRAQAFGAQDTVRTLIGHMNASVTRLEADRVMVMVFRSMAGTLVEELKEAMEAVAARG